MMYLEPSQVDLFQIFINVNQFQKLEQNSFFLILKDWNQ